MALNEDEAIVPDTSRNAARALLKIAEELELDPGVIVYTIKGFVVPTEVADRYEGPLTTNRIEDIPVSAPVTVDTTIEGEEGIIKESTEAHEPTDPGIFNREPFTSTAGETTAEAPAKNGKTEDWVAWAELHGYDKSEDLTRDELIAKYGDK